jgi:hypothetical protein
MKSLTEAAVRQYRDLGYLAPVPVLTRAEADGLRRSLEAFEATGDGMQGAVRHKPHLLSVSSPLLAITRKSLKIQVT